MKPLALLISVLSIIVLLAAACGVNPSPTPTSVPQSTPTPTVTPPASAPLTAQCLSTEAYALELIVAVIGQDRVPTAFDGINVGGCEFSDEVVKLEVTLANGNDSQTAAINLPAGTIQTGFPLAAEVTVPLVEGNLSPGKYARTVTAFTADGRSVQIDGFEPVILIQEEDSVQAELLRAQSRWERSGITRYQYTAAWQCFCMPNYIADVTVDVQDDDVLSITFVDITGDVPDPERYGTIDAFFARIQDAIDRDAAAITAEYDAMLGYPTRVFIDYEEMIADEEQGFIIRSLTAK